MKIGGVDLDKQVLVVAEIGNNHEGDPELARELIRQAARAGAGAVKFQTFRAELLQSPEDRRRLEQLRSFQLEPEHFRLLAREAREAGLVFLSTPFDLPSLAFLDQLVPAFKIASGDNTFYPLLRAAAARGKPVIMSAGLATWAELRRARELLQGEWERRGVNPGLVVLHCVSCYPTPPEQANLAAIGRLQRELGCPVGYSDHTLGIEAAVLAVALGARVIEKHFTLDHDFSDFRDHRLAADPQQMRQLVERVDQVQVLLGRGQDRPQPCEQAGREAARRSIAAARDLPAGHVLTLEDLSWTRPGRGLAPGREDLLLGRRLARALERGRAITPECLED